MKHLQLAVVAFLCVLLSLPAEAQYPQAWSAFADLGRPENQTPFNMLPAPGGGYVLMSNNQASSSVWRVSDTGAVLWQHSFPGTNGGLAVNSTGVAVSGYAGSVLYIQKFDLSGNVKWARNLLAGLPSDELEMDAAGNLVIEDQRRGTFVRKFDGNTGAPVFTVNVPVGEHYFYDLACDSSGSSYIAIDQYYPFGTVHVYKFDAAGQQVWTKEFPGAIPTGTLDASGNYYVSYSGPGGHHLMKLDGAGNVLYDTTYLSSRDMSRMVVSNSGVVLGTGFGDPVLRRFDSNGTLSWSKDFPRGLEAIALDASGNAIASYQSGINVLRLVKCDPSGNILWSHDVAGKAAFGPPSELLTDSLGRIAALVLTHHAVTNADLTVQVVNSDGSDAWTESYEPFLSSDTALHAVTDSVGDTYVGGTAGIVHSDPNYAVMKFDTAGSMRWRKQLPFVSNGALMIGPKLYPGGGCVVAESLFTKTPTTGNLTVSRFDSYGNLLWSYSDSTTSQDAKDIEVGADGSVYLACGRGVLDGDVIRKRLRILKLNPTGTLAYTADLSDNLGTTNDNPDRINRHQEDAQLVPDATGNVYAACSTEKSFESVSPTLVKLSAAGNLLWTHKVDAATLNASADNVGLDSLGNPYLLSQEGDYFEHEILHKLDSDGTELWATEVNAVTSVSLAIDPSDHIYVGGMNRLPGQSGNPVVQLLSTDGAIAWTSQLADAHVASIRDWSDLYNPERVRMVLSPAGGVLVGATSLAPVNGPTHFDYETYYILANGQRAWPATGGQFQHGAIVHDTGLNGCILADASVDGVGNVYLTGTTYGPSGTRDINVVKYNASDSAYVSQSVPSSMVAGQTYLVCETFRNTGLNNWTAAGAYRLRLLSTWGVSSVALGASESIAPGQSRTFQFYVHAPMTPGTYSFQSKMVKGSTGLGTPSPTLPVTVTVNQDAAQFLSQSVPTTIKAGSTFWVTVNVRNVGTNTWTQAGGYALRPVVGYEAWGVTSADLAGGDSISRSQVKAFTFVCTAPSTPGSYTMRWQMYRPSVGFFGDRSFTKTITVAP